MEFSKFKNHRNIKYLNWLRKQDCVIAGRVSDITHHVNMGTNSGKGIKASDYFCIPLLNEFHTTGLWAVHTIGEISFFENFKLDRDELFIGFLTRYLEEVLSFEIPETEYQDTQSEVFALTEYIELTTPSIIKPQKLKKRITKKKKAVSAFVSDFKPVQKKKVKISETDYYKKAKELKKIHDKVMRDKNKKKMSDYRKEQYRKGQEYQKNMNNA